MVKIDHHKKEVLILVAVTLFGGILRLFHLGTWSFWIDEVLCVLDAQNFSFKQFQINPVPYIAVRLSISIFGLSEFGSRVLPVFVGIASILLIYWMGNSLISKYVGILQEKLETLRGPVVDLNEEIMNLTKIKLPKIREENRLRRIGFELI